MSRELLPNRRPCLTMTVPWRNHEIIVTVGFFDDGRAGEVFAKTGKEGQELNAVGDETAQLISRLLQRNVPLSEIERGIGFDHRGEPETMVGAVVCGLRSLMTEGATA